jgi:hypothetical protein
MCDYLRVRRFSYLRAEWFLDVFIRMALRASWGRPPGRQSLRNAVLLTRIWWVPGRWSSDSGMLAPPWSNVVCRYGLDTGTSARISRMNPSCESQPSLVKLSRSAAHRSVPVKIGSRGKLGPDLDAWCLVHSEAEHFRPARTVLPTSGPV